MTRAITFTPPEGVPIRFAIGMAGARIGAQLLDLILTWAAGILFVLAVAYLNLVSFEAFFTLLSLLMFLLRVPYYVLAELVGNGRTPGKRIVGLRVISADGRRLTPWQIVARNVMKEVEFFTPLTLVLAASSDSLGTWGVWIMLVWVAVVAIVPLANRRRQRLGDMIAGTLVVEQPRAALLPDLADATPQDAIARFVFLPHQLDHYGRHELQVLEDVLRDPGTGPRAYGELASITDAIRRKIDHVDRLDPGDRRAFLLAFYRAQREHLEGRQLFGDRREDKFHGQTRAP